MACLWPTSSPQSWRAVTRVEVREILKGVGRVRSFLILYIVYTVVIDIILQGIVSSTPLGSAPGLESVAMVE